MQTKRSPYSPMLILSIVFFNFWGVSVTAQTENESRTKKIKSAFDQERYFTVYQDVGFFKKYKNTLTFYNNKMEMSFSGSHVVQGLTTTSKLPDIQLQGELQFTYKLKPKFDVYAFGKYLGNPINNAGIGQTYMNPLFEQSEIGMGIKAEIYDIQFDMGPKLIFDTQNLNSNNSLRLNTKITKKF